MTSLRYEDAVKWVAESEDPEIIDVEYVKNLTVVLFVAFAYRKNPETVAKDVVRLRKIELTDGV